DISKDIASAGLSQDISLMSKTSIFPEPYAVNHVAFIGHECLRKALDRLEGKVWGRCLTPQPIVMVHDQIAFALPLSVHGFGGPADHLVPSEDICPLLVPHHVSAEAFAVEIIERTLQIARDRRRGPVRRAHEELILEMHGLDPGRGIAALREGAKLPGERRKTA